MNKAEEFMKNHPGFKVHKEIIDHPLSIFWRISIHNTQIDKIKLKSLNPIIKDFDCTCKNEIICAMCAFKKYWKELKLE